MGSSVICIDVWRIKRTSVLRALLNMARQRRTLRNMPNVTFFKLLGTGSGRTFTIRDADTTHWVVLTAWNSITGPAQFAQSNAAAQWNSIATAHAQLVLEPLSSKGQWGGYEPFNAHPDPTWNGLTAALTRANIKVRWWRQFWKSVPPVAIDLNNTPGLITSLGIGEAPVGLQGTFSVWSSNESISNFAIKQQPHRDVIRRTHETGWYKEELFARFKVIGATGTYKDVDFDAL